MKENNDQDDFAEFKKVTIAGLGLMGGSFAKAFKNLGIADINAITRNEMVIKKAMDDGVINEADKDPSSMLVDSDLVIVCMPPEITAKYILGIQKHLKKGAVITDIAGLKEKIINEIKMNLRDDIHFIAGHPMAGKEGSGYNQSAAEIFNGSTYILVKTKCASDKVYNAYEKLIRAIGCAKIIYTEAKKHDELIALTSHLPHAISAAYKKQTLNYQVDGFTGGSYRDMTRIADMNLQLWSTLMLENKENLIPVIEDLIQNLDQLKQCLQQDNTDKMIECLSIDNNERD